MAVLGRATVELWLGKLAAAQASAEQALGVLRAIGDATWTSAALAITAEIERTRGRLGPAREHAAEAIEIAGRANSAINVMIATGHLGRILLARGEPGAAPSPRSGRATGPRLRGAAAARLVARFTGRACRAGRPPRRRARLVRTGRRPCGSSAV